MRTATVRVLAGLFALTWLLFPGFGLIDLGVTWNPSWPVVLEAGWGLFFTVVAAAFVRFAVRPRRSGPALAQLAVAGVALAASALAGAEWAALPLAGLLMAETGLVAALTGTRRRPALAVWLPLLVVAALGAVPWAWYAAAMWTANRAHAPVDVSVGVDHYAVQGALAATLAGLSLLAACWPHGRRFLGVGAGVAAAYLGTVSLAWPDRAGGVGPVWSGLALVWGLLVAGFAFAAPQLQRGELVSEIVQAE
jgi:hypothetical protein